MTYDIFEKELKETLAYDKEDPTIFYHNFKAKAASLKLRSMQCLIRDCPQEKQFPNIESLKRHLELDHQKTFCKICLKGRLVFVREQKLYNVKHLKFHIQGGDPGNERHPEILPHPWCDFCEEYFFNDQLFQDHLTRNHLTCHICGEFCKNIYYATYTNLENHFAWSHHLCPY